MVPTCGSPPSAATPADVTRREAVRISVVLWSMVAVFAVVYLGMILGEHSRDSDLDVNAITNPPGRVRCSDLMRK